MADAPPKHWSEATKDAYWAAHGARSRHEESAVALLEFAHALAEEIRSASHDAYDPGSPGVDQLGGMIAANLIDPKAVPNG